MCVASATHRNTLKDSAAHTHCNTPRHSAALCSTLARGCAGFPRLRETAFRNLASCQMGRFHSIITKKCINFHGTIHQFLQNCLDLRTNDYALLNFVQKIGKFCVLSRLLWRPRLVQIWPNNFVSRSG